MKLEVYLIKDNYPTELLLLADETMEAIDKYLYTSDVYVVSPQGSEEAIAVCCLYPIDKDTVEVKNIAVSTDYQDQGIGSFLLKEVEQVARAKQYKEVIIGTGDCGFRQIHFYEKNGYTRYGLKKNFFIENYSQPIFENGIQLKDMVLLKKEIQTPIISKATASDYKEIMNVWESSVKATHHFLKQEDFEFYKQIIPTDYLPKLDVYVLRVEEKIVGFFSAANEELEMLFIADEARGKGVGKTALTYAIRNMQVRKVDVNEQNAQAVSFYEKQGFKVVGRLERDSMGKEYPILHLELPNFTIRTAILSDITALSQLFQETVLTVNLKNYSKEEVEDWASCGNDLKHLEELITNLYFIVAENEQGVIAGFASIREDGYLHSMFVHKDFQRKGIATMLYKDIERYARSKGMQKITSEVSITAKPFFEKQGFGTDEEQKRRANQLYLTNYWMSKILNNPKIK